MTPLAISLALVLAADPAKSAGPLTIGSPAPKLAAMEFVRGDKLDALPAKTVTVIEFSGTQCGPCIRAIPHLNAMQKEHTGAVFVSVFGEEPDAVKKFLDGPGKGMEIRVACDPKGAMHAGWSDPAAQEGIPHAFIVGTDGKIAWIGNPHGMAEPLAKIVAGTFDPQADAVRLAVEQGAVLKRRKAEARSEAGQKEYARINELVIAGKHAEALTATEKALADFADSPYPVQLLRGMKLHLLVVTPDHREAAFKLATEMAVEAKATDKSATMTGMAITLLNAVEAAAADKRDTRLLDLTAPLLAETPPDLLAKPADQRRDYDSYRQQLLGWGYHLRGDSKRAAAAVGEAIEAVKGMKPADGTERKQFDALKARRVADLEAKLKEYAGGK
jgi:thiol-disulfide isomerase/thioredoxin